MSVLNRRRNVDGFEQSDLPILARIKHNGVAIVPAVISSVRYTVVRFDMSQGRNVETATGSLTVGDVVESSLQTGAKWTEDATGYNFAHTVSRTAFPGPDRYTITYWFKPTTGSEFRVVCDANIRSLEGAV